MQLHIELEGKELMPTEEIKIDPDNDNKRHQRRKKMEEYAPLIFEECYVKHKGLSKVANGFELEQDRELAEKIDPTGGIGAEDVEFQASPQYQGLHLFIMQHGFQGSSFDMRTMKNAIAIALPEAIFLQATSNEGQTDGDIAEMGYRLS